MTGAILTGETNHSSAARAEAKGAIVEKPERLRWRLSNGKAKGQGRPNQVDRMRKVMPAFQRELGSRRSDALSRKLWTAVAKLHG